jgi:hypothetical protein
VPRQVQSFPSAGVCWPGRLARAAAS